jgi:hypothetical protein
MEWQLAPATAIEHTTQALGNAQGVDMKSNRRSSTTLAEHFFGRGSLAERTHAGVQLGMEMMVDVMLEDSHYLDKCAERQRRIGSHSRSWHAGATKPTAARFAHVDEGPATGGGGCFGDEGEGSRCMVELADHLALPVPADPSDEDMLMFDEFVGQEGEGTATKSTCNLLFRFIQSELLPRRPCCNEDAGNAPLLSLPHSP